MRYKRKRARISKDPITGKSLSWQGKNIPEEYLDKDGYFDPAKWYPSNEAALLQDFLFHPNSHAAAIGVSTGYLETAVDDPRFHFFRIGPAGSGIRATALNSAQWFGKVRGVETRARQSDAGHRYGASNLIRWDPSSGCNF